MARIQDLLDRKGLQGSQVRTIGPDATVLDAAVAMAEYGIGALVVMAGERVAGIVTERDVLRRVVGQRKDPAATRVGEVMTAEVVCCSPETTTDEARGAMRDRRIRHIPVAGPDGRLVGVISIGDLNAELQAAQEQTLFLLSEYISGRV